MDFNISTFSCLTEIWLAQLRNYIQLTHLDTPGIEESTVSEHYVVLLYNIISMEKLLHANIIIIFPSL